MSKPALFARFAASTCQVRRLRMSSLSIARECTGKCPRPPACSLGSPEGESGISRVARLLVTFDP